MKLPHLALDVPLAYKLSFFTTVFSLNGRLWMDPPYSSVVGIPPPSHIYSLLDIENAFESHWESHLTTGPPPRLSLVSLFILLPGGHLPPWTPI